MILSTAPPHSRIRTKHFQTPLFIRAPSKHLHLLIYIPLFRTLSGYYKPKDATAIHIPDDLQRFITTLLGLDQVL
jgi:hypothetical protein